VSFYAEIGTTYRQCQRQRGGCRGGLHTGDRSNALERLLIERRLLTIFRVFEIRQREAYRQYLVRIEPEVGLLQLQEALDHQAGSDQQH
jgi:hypothetical protein